MKPRILLVDDEAPVLRVTRLALERAGYDVDTAQDGVEALANLRERAYDVLVTDVQMPRMSGEALCMALEHEGISPVPFIFVATGTPGIENRAWAQSMEDVELLEKPVSLRRLVARVQERLAERHTPEEKPE